MEMPSPLIYFGKYVLKTICLISDLLQNKMAFPFQVKQATSQEKGFPVANRIKGTPLGQCNTLPENQGLWLMFEFITLFLSPGKISQCVRTYSSLWWAVRTSKWLSKARELLASPSPLLHFSCKICQITGEDLKRKYPGWLVWLGFSASPEIARCQNFPQLDTLVLGLVCLHCSPEPADDLNGDVATSNTEKGGICPL